MAITGPLETSEESVVCLKFVLIAAFGSLMYKKKTVKMYLLTELWCTPIFDKYYVTLVVDFSIIIV